MIYEIIPRNRINELQCVSNAYIYFFPQIRMDTTSNLHVKQIWKRK